MMRKFIIAFAVVLFAAAQNISAERIVAVFEIVGDVEAPIKTIVRNEISAIIGRASGYSLLERQLVEQISDFDNNAQISETGKLMGADLVFVASVQTQGNNFHVSCKLIDVQTARVESHRNAQTLRIMNDLTDAVRRMTLEMLGQTNALQQPVSGDERVLSDGAVFNKGIKVYQMDGEMSKMLSQNEVQSLMENSFALQLYNQGIRRSRAGNILLYVGSGIAASGVFIAAAKPFDFKRDGLPSGQNIEQRYFISSNNSYYHYNPRQNNVFGGAFIAVGGVMTVTGAIMKATSGGLVWQAVDLLNSSNVAIDFDFTGNGARLTLTF